jgi:hypothetical protein
MVKEAKAKEARSKAPDLEKKMKEHPKGTNGLAAAELQIILRAYNIEFSTSMKKATLVELVDRLGLGAAQ